MGNDRTLRCEDTCETSRHVFAARLGEITHTSGDIQGRSRGTAGTDDVTIHGSAARFSSDTSGNEPPRHIMERRHTMTWSWKLARIAGIDVYVHATFLMLLGWIAMIHWAEGRSVAAVVSGVGFILALFACVVLHEFGHALTAQRYGIRTRDITLLPIGGLARMERLPKDPVQELWVALAGPAVNVVIALLLFALLRTSGDWEAVDRVGVARGTFVERVMLANVALVAFNLLPAFPMDGGRVLRALLATRMDHAVATQRAAWVGQAMAIVFGFIGLFSNPILVFIAFFIWIGAGQEASVVQMQSALAGVMVRQAMLTNFQTVTPENTLGDAADLILSGSQQDFPVVVDGHVAGVLTRSDLLSALAQRGREAPVAEAVQRECLTADVSEMLEAVLARLQARDCRTLPVTEHGALVGLVTMENVGEFLMIQAAQQKNAVSALRR
jgi:Zn-dependent protease